MDAVPNAIVYKDAKRVLIPKIALLLTLGVVFYLAVFFNLKLLKININLLTNIVILFVLIILIILQLFLDYLKIPKDSYKLYSDRIIHADKEQLLFKDANQLNFTRNFLDKLFNTGTIKLSPGFAIENISDVNNVYFYLQKTIRPTNIINPNYQQYYQQPNQQQTQQAPNQPQQRMN